jgi:hypothetical protein
MLQIYSEKANHISEDDADYAECLDYLDRKIFLVQKNDTKLASKTEQDLEQQTDMKRLQTGKESLLSLNEIISDIDLLGASKS